MNQGVARTNFDRRLFRGVSIAFALLVLVGFGRTYYARSLFGAPVLPSVVVHVHGLLMTAWVALFATQVGLIASRR